MKPNTFNLLSSLISCGPDLPLVYPQEWGFLIVYHSILFNIKRLISWNTLYHTPHRIVKCINNVICICQCQFVMNLHMLTILSQADLFCGHKFITSSLQVRYFGNGTGHEYLLGINNTPAKFLYQKKNFLLKIISSAPIQSK
jgi:hypothetical protein